MALPGGVFLPVRAAEMVLDLMDRAERAGWGRVRHGMPADVRTVCQVAVSGAQFRHSDVRTGAELVDSVRSWIGPREVAARLELSERQALRLISGEEFGEVRTKGRRKYVREQAVTAYVIERRAS